MTKFLIYGHGGAYNHGAEAITRQTISLIRNKYPESEIILSTHFQQQDEDFRIDADILTSPDAKLWEKEKSESPEKKNEIARQMYAEALSYIDSNTTLLSVGGDNYCYPTWHRLAVFQERAKETGAHSVLWGCSIEPVAVSTDMIKVLNTYDCILVRESLTENALRIHRIKSEIVLLPDIAFGLKPEFYQIKKSARSLVGINFSPLIERREKKTGIILENMKKLVRCILNETDCEIVLIPHVIMPMDNDIMALNKLYDSLLDEEKRKVMIIDENLTASQYKYIIACCDAFITSRTHASIAAYSSGVPCLVIGYSIKSKGIAIDLGMGEYIVNVKDILNSEIIASYFRALWYERSKLKGLLTNKMKSYREILELYNKYC
ncbi:polysaccharide pyruvyl transferase family protein [Acetobacterium wieringae]|uniref:polysaccharide pyruvyl transferase family protein n=1 Tax=Acetobacterium wieringae TaxID=52694 RepID=UPI003159400A